MGSLKRAVTNKSRNGFKLKHMKVKLYVKKPFLSPNSDRWVSEVEQISLGRFECALGSRGGRAG